MRHLLFIGACAFVIGCGGGVATVAKVGEAERTRTTLQGRDAQTLAPQAFAEADQALRAAKEAEHSGDKVAAELHAERAMAAYQRAIGLARLTRATEEETQAKEALSRAVEQARRNETARKTAEREADDLDKQLKIAREAERPSAAGPADPEREKGRLVAAQSLATQARLLCGAARLVSAQAPGLAEAEAAVADLEKKLETPPKAAPIDLAGKVRAGCLTVLTKARRATTGEADQSDALLGELSRGATPKAKSAIDLAPARDERGVVVTLRSLFVADKLSADGETVLKDLGRVAGAHPAFGVQVVLHDAAPPSASDLARGKQRGEAIAKALVDGGATAAKTKVEQAGARAPVIDPSDAKRKAKNERVEIVFVGGS
jgi:outer membrane protein OmpA-like peptidoglycan-associated protein